MILEPFQDFFMILILIYYLAIKPELFEEIKGKRVVKFLKTCKEINIAFIAYEKQVNYHFFFIISTVPGDLCS